MLKRYTEAGYQNIMNLKRRTETGWEKCQFLRRWTGSEWQTVWVPAVVSASLYPNHSDYNGTINRREDTLELLVGYYVSNSRHYQKGYINIANLSIGQAVEFEIKMDNTAYSRRYTISGLSGRSGDYENTSFVKFSGTAEKTTITLTCHTDFTDTLFTLRNLKVDGTLVPLNGGE